jgi:RNA polymerase sigma-70 factor (ECF subfamily)
VTTASATFAGRPPQANAVSAKWRDDVIALIPVLRAFAWSLSHNSADADDLVQDTLIKAWTHRAKFEPGSNLRAWLFTILRNTYYTAVARRRREVADEDDQHAASLSAEPTQEWSVTLRSLQGALAQLPHEHREALILVGAAGLTYEEASQVCGCALGTIKSRVNRARARLMKLMADEAPSGRGENEQRRGRRNGHGWDERTAPRAKAAEAWSP